MIDYKKLNELTNEAKNLANIIDRLKNPSIEKHISIVDCQGLFYESKYGEIYDYVIRKLIEEKEAELENIENEMKKIIKDEKK